MILELSSSNFVAVVNRANVIDGTGQCVRGSVIVVLHILSKPVTVIAGRLEFRFDWSWKSSSENNVLIEGLVNLEVKLTHFRYQRHKISGT